MAFKHIINNPNNKAVKPTHMKMARFCGNKKRLPKRKEYLRERVGWKKWVEWSFCRVMALELVRNMERIISIMV